MRPERRLSGRNQGRRIAALGAPFWREGAKSQGFGDRVPKMAACSAYSPKIDRVVLRLSHSDQFAHLQYKDFDMR